MLLLLLLMMMMNRRGAGWVLHLAGVSNCFVITKNRKDFLKNETWKLIETKTQCEMKKQSVIRRSAIIGGLGAGCICIWF